MNNGGRWWKAYETPGTDVCADGPDDLRKLVRQEINRGAETIKIFASAGHGQPEPHDAQHVSHRDRRDHRAPPTNEARRSVRTWPTRR